MYVIKIKQSENPELYEKQCQVEAIVFSYGRAFFYENSMEACYEIAQNLFNLLKDDPNFFWIIRDDRGLSRVGTLFETNHYLTHDQLEYVFRRGINPGLAVSKKPYGADQWLWLIGNAEFDRFSQLLDIVEKCYREDSGYDTEWLCTTDEQMNHRPVPPTKDEIVSTAFSRGLCFFGCLPNRQDYLQDKDFFIEVATGDQRKVSNNALTLLAAKGYDTLSGDQKPLNFSSLDLMRKLLMFPKMQANINYAESSLGHTALHIACIRRHYQMITLLLEHGADPNVKNINGQSPFNLLEDLSYISASVVLRYHTSPDYHPDTFKLDQDSYNDRDNLDACRRQIEKACLELSKSDKFLAPPTKPSLRL